MKGWKLWVVIALWIVLGLVGTFINNYHAGGGHGEGPEKGHGQPAVAEQH